MCFGVCAYSFAIGSLSSVLSSLDSKKAKLKRRLCTLEEIRSEYKLGYDSYIKLKQALKYDHTRDISDKYAFLNELPQSLKLEVAVFMHKKIIQKVPFFQKRDPRFIAFAAPLLKPVKFVKDTYIFMEKESIDDCNYFIFK
jgi:hypothetical protein